MHITLQTFAWMAMTVQLVGYLYQSGVIIKNKKVKSLSINTFIANFIGVFIWMISALVVRSFQAGFTNAIVLTSITVIIFYILKDKGVSPITIYVLMILAILLIWAVAILLLYDNLIKRILFINSASLKISIGVVGGLITSGAFLPQFFKIIKTKNAKDLSYVLIAAYGTSQLLWASYWGMRMTEIGISDWITGFIFASLTMTLQFTILFYKLRLSKMKSFQTSN